MKKISGSFILFMTCLLSYCQQDCDHWLSLPSQPSYFNIGQLNITGNKVTVEALINRTKPYSGGSLYAGDIVSKHDGPTDANYLLRPNSAEITTSNGYFRTPEICDIELNKTYHVAMVYDGISLKFYRNGFLMSQVAASGNLVQNNWQTRVGFYQNQAYNENFIGYINEVRIWNLARTQNEIQSHMSSSLPSPTTQSGLLAYYTFDNLLNKQGNTAWNGTLGGSATINAINTSCVFLADSCNTKTNISNIINDYTPVVGLYICDNKISVQNAGSFKTGDTVLMIQMKGAIIDSSNSSSFGTVTNYKNAGNYEFNYIKSIAGNIIELKNSILRSYDIPEGKVQLIRVPYYNNVNINSTLTCLPWDGSKGGVLVLNVQETITLNANIDVTGKGFSGGKIENPKNNAFYCHENDYYYPKDPKRASPKGEGIASISDGKLYGKGPLANGGGGGLEHNSGGAGGSNGTMGGKGGREWITCGPPIDNGGIGGNPLVYNNNLNKLFLGGGGGAGHCDNIPGFNPNGGNGGGIIIIKSNLLMANGHSIIANGSAAAECTRDNQQYKCHEGMGGGGGGGAVLISTTNFLDNISINVTGGKGADMKGEIQGKLGPGGGGSGGVCWLNLNSLLPTILVNKKGGSNGVNIDFGNDSYGATPGLDGINLFDLKLPFATIPFKKNIDSVRINDIATGCTRFDFKGLAYTNANPINNYQWYFGDGNTSSLQNTNHTFNASGTFDIKLVVTDINGCMDSLSKPITTTNIAKADFSFKQDICNPLSVQFFNAGQSPSDNYWDFGDGTMETANTNPIHMFSGPGNYSIKYGIQDKTCTDTVFKTITLTITSSDIISTKDTTICFGSSKKLSTNVSLGFCWSPAIYLDDPTLANPSTSTPQSITYYLTAEVQQTNRIVNGDFEQGNIYFASDYNYSNINNQEGQYFTGANPTIWNPSFSNCKDHTSGSGKMLLVKGSSQTNAIVWSQNISVIPNTNYAFTTWVQPLSTTAARLQFSIDHNAINSDTISSQFPSCNWKQFSSTWNSGNKTNITIAIINPDFTTQAADFALDDISFAPVEIKRDSVIISVENPKVKANEDSLVCAGSTIQFTSSGAEKYQWTPANGVSDANISNPSANVFQTTQFLVTGTTKYGCFAKDSFTVFVIPKPSITKTTDTTICRNTSVQLWISGGKSYLWTPTSSLDDPTAFDPVATPLSNTTYYISIKDNSNCTYTDSIKIALRPDPVFTVSSDTTICKGDSLRLSANGGTLYQWMPTNAISDPYISNPIVFPDDNTQYKVKITDLLCNNSMELVTDVSVKSLPHINAYSTNNIDCSFLSSQLNASGAKKYSWSPSASLNNNGIVNPVASPVTTTTYLVKGTDVNGCSNTDTITVFVNYINKGENLVYNAFTPNGDGLNDCFGIRHWGNVENLDFSIYNRWGERVFHTTDVNQCWNGIYKGKMQDAAVFVYLIKAKSPCGDIYKQGTFTLIR